MARFFRNLCGILAIALLLLLVLACYSCKAKEKDSEAVPVEEPLPKMESPAHSPDTMMSAPENDSDGGGSYSYEEKAKTPEDKASK